MEIQEQLNKAQYNSDEVDKLNSKLKTEQLLKEQAINKLSEVLNRKDMAASRKNKDKASSADLKKKEKDCRRLQQELTLEREKYGQLAAKWQKDMQDLQVPELFYFNNIKLELACLSEGRALPYYRGSPCGLLDDLQITIGKTSPHLSCKKSQPF